MSGVARAGFLLLRAVARHDGRRRAAGGADRRRPAGRASIYRRRAATRPGSAGHRVGAHRRRAHLAAGRRAHQRTSGGGCASTFARCRGFWSPAWVSPVSSSSSSHAHADGGETWWPLTVVRAGGRSLVVARLSSSRDRRGRATRLAAATRDVRPGLPRLRGVAAVPALRCRDSSSSPAWATWAATPSSSWPVTPTRFSVAVVLSSLYPVVTTLLAALLLRERLRPLQIAGVVLASLSVPAAG